MTRVSPPAVSARNRAKTGAARSATRNGSRKSGQIDRARVSARSRARPVSGPYSRTARISGSGRRRKPSTRPAGSFTAASRRSGFDGALGHPALQEEGQPGHDVAAHLLDGPGAGIVLGDDVGVFIGQDVERFGDVAVARQQLDTARAVAEEESGGGVEPAAGAETLRL